MIVKHTTRALGAIALTAALTQPSFAETPMKIGSEVILDQELVVEYAQTESAQIISHPGADFIKVHFSKLDLTNGDTVTVSNPDGSEKFTYPGDPITSTGDGGFWSLSISGEQVVIKINGVNGQPPSASTIENVVIDKYTYGDFDGAMSHEGPVLESVCGSNDWQNAACYSGTTEYENSHATTRVIFQKNGSSYTCSGWRVGPSTGNDLAITNEHCLENAAIAATAEFWFNFQYNNCGGSGSATSNRVVATVNSLLEVSQRYDMALVKLNNPASFSSFGFYELDNRAPLVGEQIYIPQHPGGIPKVISIYSDQNGSGKCEIEKITDYGGNDASYSCDTDGGSSGSPVIASSTGRVIALHHYGSCSNSGVKVERFYRLVEPYLGGDVPPPPVGDKLKVEAESGSLSGTADYYNDSSASGGQGVAYLNGAGASVTLKNIPASTSMAVTYASQNSGGISVYVNGTNAGNLNFNSNGAWVGNYTTANMTLSIPAGASVKFQNDRGDAALNIDFVTFNLTDGGDTGICTGTDIPSALVSATDETTANANDGSITFSFDDDAVNGGSRTNIEFSIDGGSSYPRNVADNSGSTTINNLAPGTYDLWVRWGNNECATDLGNVTINPGSSVVENVPPMVDLPDGAGTLFSGDRITIDASASDSDGQVASVAFVVNFPDGTSERVIDNTAPYRISFIMQEGFHSVTAIAEDNEGATSEDTFSFTAINRSEPSDDFEFGIESDGTVYHLDGGQTGAFVYLCVNGDCRSATLVDGRYERKTDITSGSYDIEFKIQDNATGQCIFSAKSVEVGSGVDSGCY